MAIQRVLGELDSARSPLHWCTFFALLIIAVGVRLVAFQGYSGSDSREYALLANDLAHGTLNIATYKGPAVFPLRLGLYAPAAAIIRLLGLSEMTLVAYPFVISFLGCLLVYGMTRHLATPLAGLIALGAIAIVPLDVAMASRLLPDAIAAFWANVALAFTFAAMGKATKPWHILLLGFAGGLCLGVSWLCKETVVYLFPFLAILVLVVHRERRWAPRIACVVAMAAGCIVAVLGESILYFNLTGDPLYRLHETERNYKQCAIWFFDEASPDYGWKSQGYVQALIARLTFQGPKSILYHRPMALAPAMAILGALWMGLFRPRSCVIPTVWLVSLLFMFNFMTSSFTGYRPLPLFDRYLYPILLPSLVIIGSFLACLLNGFGESRVDGERRFWAVILLVGFCGLSFYSVRSLTKLRPEHVERRIAVQLRDGDVIYSDSDTAANLVFFRTGTLLRANDVTIAWEGIAVDSLLNNSYVLIRRDRIKFLSTHYGYKAPEYAAAPPSTWKSVWREGEAELFCVATVATNNP